MYESGDSRIASWGARLPHVLPSACRAQHVRRVRRCSSRARLERRARRREVAAKSVAPVEAESPCPSARRATRLARREVEALKRRAVSRKRSARQSTGDGDDIFVCASDVAAAERFIPQRRAAFAINTPQRKIIASATCRTRARPEIGVEPLQPGTPDATPHLRRAQRTGKFFSRLTPFNSGPRHGGQLSRTTPCETRSNKDEQD